MESKRFVIDNVERLREDNVSEKFVASSGNMSSEV